MREPKRVAAKQRCSYNWRRVGMDVIVIIDTDLGDRSVTNDVELVVQDLVAQQCDVDNLHLIYRDSIGRYDAILTAQGKFEGFSPLATKSEAEAIARVRAGS